MRFSRENNKKIVSSLILCVCLSTTSLALAMLIPQRLSEVAVKEPSDPRPLGRFAITVVVKNVSDVYGWQVGLRFDPQKMSVMSFKPGDFLGTPLQDNKLSESVKDLESTLFFSQVYPDGTLVLCQTLKGEHSPISGSGTLAVIEFQYYSLDFEKPRLIFNDQARGTMLGRKDATEIPISYDQIILEFEFLF